ncbi:MAG: tetratricopeptide repeat protein, partial [Nostocales cyanobacterium ELA608]
MSLQSGLNAFQQGQYQEAVYLLEEFSQNSLELNSPDYLTAQMWLVKAYQKIGRTEQATVLWQKLINSDNLQAREWAEKNQPVFSSVTQSSFPKAGRAATMAVNLAMGGVDGSLALASGVTIALLFGMVFVLGLSLVLIFTSSDPITGLAIAIGITLIFNLAAFFLSPFLMDL